MKRNLIRLFEPPAKTGNVRIIFYGYVLLFIYSIYIVGILKNE